MLEKSPEQRAADKAIGRVLNAIGELNDAMRNAGMEAGITEIRMPKKDLRSLDRLITIYLAERCYVRDDGGLREIMGIRFISRPE